MTYQKRLEQIQAEHWSDGGKHTPEYAACDACVEAITQLFKEVFDEAMPEKKTKPALPVAPEIAWNQCIDYARWNFKNLVGH